MNEILQAISTVGFPIVACGVMAYYVKYQHDKHTEEINTMREAIENNTLVVKELVDAIKGEGV